MKKLLLLFVLTMTVCSCEESGSSDYCSYNGHSLHTGEKGGCYYYSGSKKVYVDKSYCKSCY